MVSESTVTVNGAAGNALPSATVMVVAAFVIAPLSVVWVVALDWNPGRVVQVTLVSLQAPPLRKTWYVRLAPGAVVSTSLSVAERTMAPAGIEHWLRSKRMRPTRSAPLFDRTL